LPVKHLRLLHISEQSAVVAVRQGANGEPQNASGTLFWGLVCTKAPFAR
jgi:hypothetical protein